MSLRPTIERAGLDRASDESLSGIRLTVLVVDDDANINLLLQTRLKLRGLEVISATNGQEALDALARVPVDLMLLDVSMPVMGGMEVLAQVRARRLDVA